MISCRSHLFSSARFLNLLSGVEKACLACFQSLLGELKEPGRCESLLPLFSFDGSQFPKSGTEVFLVGSSQSQDLKEELELASWMLPKAT